ncbi:MAG: MgtC/SapB family protein [Planctomycetes bacterium]|nr:MgtC/SapB family protein [Planctomycetota bacterium]
MHPTIPEQDLLTFARQVVIAGALGLAVGLERERSSRDSTGTGIFAGIRTFSIGGIMGCVAAFLAQATHPLLFAAVFIILGLICAISYYRDMDDRPGVTTEVAFLLIFLCGGLVHFGYELHAAGVALGLTALLTYKTYLQEFAGKVSRDDLANTLKFGLISLVVLPLIPSRTYDPWGALNPHKIWLLVVLISGISFTGYILVQTLGAKAGIGLTGLLGGIVSSTATTTTFAQRSRDAGVGSLLPHFALAASLACTVMYPRLLIEAAVVSRPFAIRLLWPLGIATVVGAVFVYILYRLAGTAEGISGEGKGPKLKNPFDIWPAVKFAAFFALVLLAFKYVQKEFGAQAVLGAAFLSGLTDTDAVLLSMADAYAKSILPDTPADQRLPDGLGEGAVVLACLANTFVKVGILWSAGAPGFRSRAAVTLLAMAAGAGAGLWFLLA